MTTEAAAPILYLVHRFPFPPDKGDRIRAYHILRFLRSVAPIHVACVADEPIPPGHFDALRASCDRLSVHSIGHWRRRLQMAAALSTGESLTTAAFFSRSFRSTIRHWARERAYRAVLLSSSGMMPCLNLAELRSLPVVVDLVDVDSEKWLQYARESRPPLRWLYAREGRLLRRLEQTASQVARAVTVVSRAEAELLERVSGPGPIRAITNGVDLEYFQPAPPSRNSRYVFVGALDYYPNVAGILWFCHHVWRKLKEVRPNAQLAIVGRRPVAEVLKLRDFPGIEVVGQVDDVRPELARAAIAIAPLGLARGVQNKVLEAMATARPVIVTPQVLRGISAKPGEELEVANTVDEWLRNLTNLLDSDAIRLSLGNAARRYVERCHDWNRCLQPFAELFDDTPVGADRRSE